MRTVCGLARWVHLLGRRTRSPVRPVASVRPLAAGRSPLLLDRLGEQARGGARLDQVDGTTCGSAVLVALAAWADPAEMRRLDGIAPAVDAAATGSARTTAAVAPGFGARYDARQRQVHRESTRFWPRLLGTSPWGMAGWLRRHAPAAGPYRVLLVDDTSAVDLAGALDAVHAALAAGRPVPLLVGTLLPRHYVLALGATGSGRRGDGRWRVYEPTSGQVRAVDPDLVRGRALGPVLGFDRLHAVLLPS